MHQNQFPEILSLSANRMEDEENEIPIYNTNLVFRWSFILSNEAFTEYFKILHLKTHYSKIGKVLT